MLNPIEKFNVAILHLNRDWNHRLSILRSEVYLWKCAEMVFLRLVLPLRTVIPIQHRIITYRKKQGTYGSESDTCLIICFKQMLLSFIDHVLAYFYLWLNCNCLEAFSSENRSLFDDEGKVTKSVFHYSAARIWDTYDYVLQGKNEMLGHLQTSAHLPNFAQL